MDIPKQIGNLGIKSIKLDRDGVLEVNYLRNANLVFYPQVLRLFEYFPYGTIEISENFRNIKTLSFLDDRAQIRCDFVDEKELEELLQEFSNLVIKGEELKGELKILRPIRVEFSYERTKTLGLERKMLRIPFVIGMRSDVLKLVNSIGYIGGITVDFSENKLRFFKGYPKGTNKKFTIISQYLRNVVSDPYDLGFLEEFKNILKVYEKRILDVWKKALLSE